MVNHAILQDKNVNFNFSRRHWLDTLHRLVTVAKTSPFK